MLPHLILAVAAAMTGSPSISDPPADELAAANARLEADNATAAKQKQLEQLIAETNKAAAEQRAKDEQLIAAAAAA